MDVVSVVSDPVVGEAMHNNPINTSELISASALSSCQKQASTGFSSDTEVPLTSPVSLQAVSPHPHTRSTPVSRCVFRIFQAPRQHTSFSTSSGQHIT